MSNKKNMLEAFRSAKESSAKSDDGSAGPFAGLRARAGARSSSERSARIRFDWDQLPGWLPWAIGMFAAFIIGLGVGRLSTPPGVDAAGKEGAPIEGGSLGSSPDGLERSGGFAARSDEPGGSSKPLAREGEAREGSGSAAELGALYDTKNRFTIVVAHYAESRSDYAWNTYDHLLRERLPVFPPVARGRNIQVFVGAAPASKDLEALKQEIRRLEGWDGARGGYEDAYIERIDKLIKR